MEFVTELLEAILRGALDDRRRRAEWNRQAAESWQRYGAWVALAAITHSGLKGGT